MLWRYRFQTDWKSIWTRKIRAGKSQSTKKKNRGRAVHFYNVILLLYSLLVLTFNCLQTTLQQISPEQYHHDSLQALIFLNCFLTKRTSSAIILTVHVPGTSEKGSVELFPGIVTKAGSLLGGKTISLLWAAPASKKKSSKKIRDCVKCLYLLSEPD